MDAMQSTHSFCNRKLSARQRWWLPKGVIPPLLLLLLRHLVRVCTCIHTDTHTWEYAWECIGYVCACKFVQKCTCAYIYICVHVYLCACIFIYACMYVCAYAPCPPFHTHVSLSLTHSVDRVRPLSLPAPPPVSPRIHAYAHNVGRRPHAHTHKYTHTLYLPHKYTPTLSLPDA